MERSTGRLETCPLCDGKLEIGKTTETFKYRGRIVSVEMVGEHCPSCDEGFQNDDDMEINEHNIALAKKHVDNLMSEKIARVRKQLGLSQEEAAKIFGGGIRAFHKYEKGIVKPPQTLDILFDLLESGAITLEEIRSNQNQKIA